MPASRSTRTTPAPSSLTTTARTWASRGASTLTAAAFTPAPTATPARRTSTSPSEPERTSIGRSWSSPEAPELLREAFDQPKWKGERVVFSGVTDCYQPLEASYRITRGCLEVCAEYRNPAGIISKSPLVERDIDVMQELTRVAGFSVMVSVPFWDEAKARAIEPFVTTPARRVRAIERLAKAGIPVGVMVAPIIPGLNDEDMGEVLRAAQAAGATRAGMVLLRLPGPVKDVFEERLRAALPLRADKVVRRIKETRGGKMYDARFSVRGTGEGPYAEAIAALFEQTCAKLGLSSGSRHDEPEGSTFRRPRGQMALF